MDQSLPSTIESMAYLTPQSIVLTGVVALANEFRIILYGQDKRMHEQKDDGDGGPGNNNGRLGYIVPLKMSICKSIIRT